MRRAFLIGLFAVAAIAGVTFALGAGSAKGKTYKVVLDSAFGLVKGADFKVGGVAVGSISDLDVERETARAVVEVEVASDSSAFSGLRDSATCTVAPQSLIGEYFVDCQPGKDGELLDSGATVPVDRTSSPIPPDLVLNVMRQPIAERFTIILGELGIGFAGRGADVNETIRRAVPALQTTNEVLALLADKRQTLASLSRDSGQVFKVLGERRDDVGDFVVEANNAAQATAVRRVELAETFRRFPDFLDQLEPTMRDLGTATRLQAPALADLRAAAPTVNSLLDTLGPFARASEPAVDTLGDASRAGRVASREAASLVSRLSDLGTTSREPANNLDIILDHLNDRENAVEPDPGSPTGAGYTGLEAPLQYFYDQALALNIFDQRGYSLKIDLTPDECREYTTADDVNASAEARGVYDRCNQNLGPNQPGITTPDPSSTGPVNTRDDRRSEFTLPGAGPDSPSVISPAAPGATPAPPAATPADPAPLQPLEDLTQQLPDVPSPDVPAPAPAQDLLDFLLG